MFTDVGCQAESRERTSGRRWRPSQTWRRWRAAGEHWRPRGTPRLSSVTVHSHSRFHMRSNHNRHCKTKHHLSLGPQPLRQACLPASPSCFPQVPEPARMQGAQVTTGAHRGRGTHGGLEWSGSGWGRLAVATPPPPPSPPSPATYFNPPCPPPPGHRDVHLHRRDVPLGGLPVCLLHDAAVGKKDTHAPQEADGCSQPLVNGHADARGLGAGEPRASRGKRAYLAPARLRRC